MTRSETALPGVFIAAGRTVPSTNSVPWTKPERSRSWSSIVHVLHGRVRLGAGRSRWDGSPGDLIVVPDERHDLEALEDSVVLLTVAKLP